MVGRESVGSNEATNLLGRDILSASPWQREQWLHQAFSHWRRHGFPFPRLEKKEVEREFRSLEQVYPGDVLHRRHVHASTLGLRLANSFHPQMWKIPAHRHARAPLDHFKDDATLHKLLQRAARFWPNRRCWNAQCIRGIFRIYAGGRVANFRPAAARAIIARYSAPGETILDFSAGFGGRLLGCLTLERSYIGVDPAGSQILGLRRMLKSLQPLSSTHARIIRACAEDFMPRLDSAGVDLIFSSPPYFNIEKYSQAESQSYRRYKTYGAWKQHFLRAVIKQSHRVLRPGGYLVINVANTRDYTIARDLSHMGCDYFGTPHVLRLLMHARPMQRAYGTRHYRWEPILAFRKTM